MALLLAAIGLYGVLAYSVSQRSHEIGVRMALGASTREVLRLVLKQGFTLALTGLAMGTVAAVGLARLLRSLLSGIEPGDPLTFTAVSLLLALVAGLACAIPARPSRQGRSHRGPALRVNAVHRFRASCRAPAT